MLEHAIHAANVKVGHGARAKDEIRHAGARGVSRDKVA